MATSTIKNSETRTALITGANKSIGFEIARQLGKAGFTTFLGARDAGRGEEAARKLRDEGLDARMIEVDLGNLATIQSAAAKLESEFHSLDVLVNNAGIVDPADGPPSRTVIEAVRRVMETNFLGTLAVTQAMLPLLRKAASARVVNLSSGLGSITLNSDPEWEFAGAKILGYNASKAALNMLTVQLAFELRDTKIKVNSADPGFTATDMNQHRGYQTIEQGAAEAIRLALLPEDGPTGGFYKTGGHNPW